MPMTAETRQQFEEEEQAYWRQRDELLCRYSGQWVAIVGGRVVAVGEQMNKVAAEALRTTGSGLMYVNRVGREDAVLRVRQVADGRYHQSYSPPIPMVTATIRDVRSQSPTQATFIVDTGADLTVLQEAVADEVNLWNDVAGRMQVAGIGGAPQSRFLYNALVEVAGHAVLVAADCRDDIGEDILGRDVINEFALTVCAQRDQVQFEWIEGS